MLTEFQSDIPEELRRRFSRVPVNRHFRLQLVSRSTGESVISMELLPDYLQEEGVVHGGIITTLADSAAVYSVHPDLDDKRTMTSIEFTMNFLRPVLLDKGPLTARSSVVQRGRLVVLCEVEVTQEGNLVAKGSFTYLFIDRDD